MKRIVLDIETDGLLEELTRMWVICTQDIDTDEKRHWGPDDGLGWQEYINTADVIIGHNIISYDLAALYKLYGWRPDQKVRIKDTLIMSKWLNYQRFGMAGHSLARWGELLGYPKIEFSDWSRYSEEMLVYCQGDCELCKRIYMVLTRELSKLITKSKYASVLLRAEHDAARWASDAEIAGWPFDCDGATVLYDSLCHRVDEIQSHLEPLLGVNTVPVDMKGGVVEYKELVTTKTGFYPKYVATWFGIQPIDAIIPGLDLVGGPYSRVEFKPRKLSSVTDVKRWLYSVGWVPTEWNTKFDPTTRKNIKTSPKITEDSLEFLKDDGAVYAEYLMVKSRRDILRGMLDNCKYENGEFRVHGNANILGTPSMRATHRVIVNIPRVTSEYGAEMRALFRVSDGWVQIGADSTSNQLRGLCYYLGNEEYTTLVVSGDVHTYHRDIVNAIIKDVLKLEPSCTRDDAKRLIYALLFGCGDEKTAIYTLHKADEDKGKIIKSLFLKRVAGIAGLLSSLERESKRNNYYGSPYIRGLGGNPLYANGNNTLLCYLLQAFEKATTSTAITWLVKELTDRGIPFQPLVYMHDEVQFMVPEEYGEIAKTLGALAFKEGPKLAGVDIMEGVAKIGKNWKDCH